MKAVQKQTNPRSQILVESEKHTLGPNQHEVLCISETQGLEIYENCTGPEISSLNLLANALTLHYIILLAILSFNFTEEMKIHEIIFYNLFV